MSKRSIAIWRGIISAGIIFSFEIVAADAAAPEKHDNKSGSIEIIRASEAEYVTVAEGNEGVFILRGGIILRSGPAYLRAETVKINTKTGEIFGEGRVSMEAEGRKLAGEKFYYDNHLGSGVVYSSHAAAEPFYFSGSVIKQIEANRYIARDSFFTTCNEKYPHYYFKAKKIWISKNNEFAAISAIYYVGQVPVFYWPLILKSDTGTGLVTQYAVNPTRGQSLQNTWNFTNPFANESRWQPQTGKLMFDWYERVGYMIGINLKRDSPDLKYNFEIAMANFKARRTISDDSGSPTVTNQVLQPDGTYGLTQYFWYKLKADLKANLHRSNKNDSVSSAYVRFGQYNNANFELEFGQRFEPDNTLTALYRPRFFQQGLGAYYLNWETGYSYTNKNTQISLRAQRQLNWFLASNIADSKFSPVYDIAPDLLISHRTTLMQPTEGFFKGIQNRVQLNSQFRQDYTIQQVNNEVTSTPVKSLLRNDGFDQVSFYLSFAPWLNLIPSGGVGMQYYYTSIDDPLLQREMNRQSYGYLFTNDTLRVGYPFLYAQGVYTQRYSFGDVGPDLTFGHDRMQAATTSIISDLNPYALITIQATRDLRPYPNPLLERERWSDLTARVQGDYDFIRGFTANLYGLSKRKFNHFNGIGILNNAAYSIQYQTMNTNDFQFYYRLGGYKLPFIRELMLFKATSTFRYNFINIMESNLRLGFEIDMRLHEYWRFRFALNSIAEQFERYQPGNPAYVPFFDDVLKSMNPFNPSTNGVLNLDNFMASIEHDLHKWLLRVSFTSARKTLFTGTYMTDRTSFIEQTVFVSFTLKDISGFGLPYTELYRYNPTDAGIR
ncbi:MAG: LPS-assembly protein LptD [Spirochaetes bacterium]|nr:LPS-assembly protein LptD [Spirochaetota bacterium]